MKKMPETTTMNSDLYVETLNDFISFHPELRHRRVTLMNM